MFQKVIGIAGTNFSQSPARFADPHQKLVTALTVIDLHTAAPGDILADSGYPHRDDGAWALPLRRAGAALVQDLHSHDRGPKGTHEGAVTAKDPASNDISRDWCRLTGLASLMLFTAVLLTVRNQRILAAWNARQEENTRRAARGLPPKTRRRRRQARAMLPAATGPP